MRSTRRPPCHRVLWSEIEQTTGGGWSRSLGPAIAFDAGWFRSAAERYELRRADRLHAMGSL